MRWEFVKQTIIQSHGKMTPTQINKYLEEIKNQQVQLHSITFSTECETEFWDKQEQEFFITTSLKKFNYALEDEGSFRYIDKWGIEQIEKAILISLAYVKVDLETIAIYQTYKGKDTHKEYAKQYLIKPYHYEVSRLINFTQTEAQTEEEERRDLLIIARVLGYPLLAMTIVCIVLWIIAACQ